MAPNVVLAGGGSAGHISPALALADALRRAEPRARIACLGTERGLETRLVPIRGYELMLIPPVPLPRSLTPELLSVPGRMAAAVRAAAAVLDQTGADVLVGLGGYVATPAYLAARLRRVPIVVHEANVRPGLANRIGALLTRHVFTGQQGTRLMHSQFIGIPVRREIAGLSRLAMSDKARAHFGLRPDLPVLLVTGGSQGARSLNRAAFGASDWLRASGVQVLHIVGPRTGDEVVPPPGEVPYVAVEYVDRMELAYAAADFALCRAGAITCAELTAVGLPAAYVPLPHGNGEQRLNAAPIAAAGGGILVSDAELTPDWIAQMLLPVLADPELVAAMSRAAAEMGRADADQRLAAEVLEVAAGGSRPDGGRARPPGRPGRIPAPGADRDSGRGRQAGGEYRGGRDYPADDAYGAGRRGPAGGDYPGRRQGAAGYQDHREQQGSWGTGIAAQQGRAMPPAGHGPGGQAWPADRDYAPEQARRAGHGEPAGSPWQDGQHAGDHPGRPGYQDGRAGPAGGPGWPGHGGRRSAGREDPPASQRPADDPRWSGGADPLGDGWPAGDGRGPGRPDPLSEPWPPGDARRPRRADPLSDPWPSQARPGPGPVDPLTDPWPADGQGWAGQQEPPSGPWSAGGPRWSGPGEPATGPSQPYRQRRTGQPPDGPWPGGYPPQQPGSGPASGAGRHGRAEPPTESWQSDYGPEAYGPAAGGPLPGDGQAWPGTEDPAAARRPPRPPADPHRSPGENGWRPADQDHRDWPGDGYRDDQRGAGR